MSEPNIGGSCAECGRQYEHRADCSKAAKPPVYDLAEFERQLEAQMQNYPMGRDGKPSFGDILDALQASRKQ